MPLDESLKLLEDMRDAAAFILDRTGGMTLSAYDNDRLTRNAVERNFITLGEAMNRLARRAPETAAALGAFSRIVAFRNRVVHGYDTVDNTIVWAIIQKELPRLLQDCQEMLRRGTAGS